MNGAVWSSTAGFWGICVPKPELAVAASVRPSDVRLHSDLVCRVAGLPVGALEALRAEDSLAALAASEEAVLALAEHKEPLAASLFEAIGGQDDQNLRRAFLGAKRDVHNLRPPKEGHLRAIRDAGYTDLAASLEAFRRRALDHRSLLSAFSETFRKERMRLRARFQELIGDEDFRRGLLLSSRTLSDEAHRFLRASPERPNTKARQIERSLMRYFSRMAMKATPFGTFCALMPGAFDPQTRVPRFSADPRQKRSQLRLNKVLYAVLVGHLQGRPDIRCHLEVELNPTLQAEAKKWLFLQATLGREVFHRLPRNPVLNLLAEQLKSRHHLPLAELVRELETHVEIEATSEEATAYLDRLLALGFLRFRLGIREQEVDWDRPLLELLQPIDVPEARQIIALLKTLRATIDAYPEADLEQRRKLLDKSSSSMHELMRELGTRPAAPSEMPPFYEDAAGRARLTLSPGTLPEVLAEYLDLVCRLSWFHCEQANMRCFFKRFYEEGAAIPLLRFYEDYYREHFKSFLEKQRQQGHRHGHDPAVGDRADANPIDNDKDGEDGDTEEDATQPPPSETLRNPFDLDLINKVFAAQEKIGALIRKRWRAAPSAEEIILERDELSSLLQDVPEVDEPCRSVSVFAQLVPDLPETGGTPSGGTPSGGSGPKLVVAGIFNGYGKYFSRFLYLLPDSVAENLRTTNLELSDHLLAEICGDGSFNANLHPPLMPWEISYPTGESGADKEQIPSSELLVEADSRTPHKLRLRWTRGDREVVPVDLGFLNPRMRPPLFQLLSHFTPAAAYSQQIPPVPVANPAEAKEGDLSEAFSGPVLYRPRVTYRGQLVLSRRRWTVPGAVFPHPQKGEPEEAYFQRLQEWRRMFDIPEEAFFRIQLLPAPQELPSRSAAAPGKDLGDGGGEDSAPKASPEKQTPPPRVRQHLHKPQYLDFGNPLLVDLFGRSTANLPHFEVHLEEMLPGRRQLLSHGTERFVTELILQVDFPTRGRETP